MAVVWWRRRLSPRASSLPPVSCVAIAGVAAVGQCSHDQKHQRNSVVVLCGFELFSFMGGAMAGAACVVTIWRACTAVRNGHKNE